MANVEEIATFKDPVATTAEEASRALKSGHARFFGGRAQRPEASAAERRAQILGQTPFGVVLSCSDSRVPTEIVFDQGLGDLCITRVAGSVVDRTTLGSIEYAVGHLKTHVVVVMGHEGCGAVKAALLPAADRARETENMQFLLDQIVPSVEKLPAIRDEKAKMREAVIANVRVQVQNLKKMTFIQDAIRSKRVAVIGAFYEITSGAVDVWRPRKTYEWHHGWMVHRAGARTFCSGCAERGAAGDHSWQLSLPTSGKLQSQIMRSSNGSVRQT